MTFPNPERLSKTGVGWRGLIPDCNAVGGVVCDVILLGPWERNLSFCKAPLMTESGDLENERWSVRVKAFGSRDPGD